MRQKAYLYNINLGPISCPFMEVIYYSFGVATCPFLFYKCSHHIDPHKMLSPHSSSQISI